MITITPNLAPPNLGGQMRFPPPGAIQTRVQAPQRPQFFQPFRAYRQGGTGPVIFDPEFDGKRLRKSAMRKTVDYNASIIKMLESRVWQRDFRDRYGLLPDAMYTPELLPPSAYEDNPINAVTTRFVKTATNKMRCPIFCMAWTPEGRRLVTGASSGEFTLWNGLTFNFETILQAHESPVRTMVWSHNEMWMVTADHSGYVKYWQSNMNNVKMFMAHQEPIRGISFSASDSKFASCSDDGTVKIWDFYRCIEERTLRGHGADVKCVHWHPHKGLVISGSKDNQQPVKLWDPKTGNPLATIHAHKSTVMDIKWNDNGNWFVTASRDHLLKLFDIRHLSSEVQTFRGHKKESSSVAWHPVHEGLFCSGGSDGAILFWHVGADKEVGVIEQAHDSIVWTLAWHPMGHILCSGSNDHTSKFWTRNRPGDAMKDKYNLNTLNATPLDQSLENDIGDDGMAAIPGMGPEDKVEVDKDLGMPGTIPVGPGAIPGLEDITDIMSEEKTKAQTKRVPYSKPIPKNFQAQWNDTVVIESDEDSRDEVDMVALLNQLLEHHPGVKPISQIQPEALYIYGKVLAVEPGSELAQMISEGGERLIKYIHSGAVKELEDVIPHYETEDGQTMPYITYDFNNKNIPLKSLEASDRFPPLSELFPGYDFNECGYPMDGIKDGGWIEETEEPEEDRRDVHRRDNYRPHRDRDRERERERDRDRDEFRRNRDHDRDNDFREEGNFREEGFRNEGRRNFNRRERDGFRNEENFGRNDRNDNGGFNRNEGRNFNRNENRGFNRNEGGNFNRNEGGGFNRNESGGFNRNEGGAFNRNESGGFNRNEGGGGFNRNEGGGFNRNEGGFNRNESGGFNRNDGGNFNRNDGNNFNRNDSGNFNRNDGFNSPGGGFNRNEGCGFGGRDNNYRSEGRFENNDKEFAGRDYDQEYREEDDYVDNEDSQGNYNEDYDDDDFQQEDYRGDDSRGGFGNRGGRFRRGNDDRGPRGRGGANNRRGKRKNNKGRVGKQSGGGSKQGGVGGGGGSSGAGARWNRNKRGRKN